MTFWPIVDLGVIGTFFIIVLRWYPFKNNIFSYGNNKAQEKILLERQRGLSFDSKRI